MKGSKLLITLGMIGVLAGGWGVFWSKNIHSYLEYKNLLASAEDSLKDGLYEQAIERYQQSLSYSDDIKTYQKIKETYSSLKSAMSLDHRIIFQGSLDSIFFLFRALWNSCIF